MEKAAKLARAGNCLLSGAAWVLVVMLLLYGGYALWDTAMTFQGAFVSSELLHYKPTEEDPANPTLAELQAINPDVRAWLTVDGTHIDYPVVQGEDDMEYVNKDVYGAFAFSGSIFLDSRNSRDFSDPYCLLYGHHMDNGAMFGDVTRFTDQNYFDENQTGTLYLTGKTKRITFFACVKADAYDSVIYNTTGQDTETLLQHIQETAVQSRSMDAAQQGQIIALSTCADAETNGRIVLFGWMK